MLSKEIRIGRVGSYPTSVYNTIGQYAFEISKHVGFVSYVAAPITDGERLALKGVKEFFEFGYTARSKKQVGRFSRIFNKVTWLTQILCSQFQVICFFVGKRLDVIHVHSQLYTLVAYWGQLTGKRVVITFHGEDFNNLERSRFLQSIMGVYHKVCLISPHMIEGMKNMVSPDVVIYTPNGIDKEIFYPKNAKREKSILMVGSFKKVKRHELAIEAFSKVLENQNYRDYQLKLIGSGPRVDEIKELVSSLNVGNVVFVGSKTSAELVEEYNNGALLLLCSEREGFPKVIMEGLSCGIKIATTKVGAVSEVLGEDYPHYFHEINAESMAEVIVGALKDESTYSHRIERYSWDNLRAQFADIYR